MEWNWEQPDWPHFAWDASRLRQAEEHFLLGTGMFAGTVKHLLPLDREQLAIEAMSGEAVTTSEIEGEILDRASVQSSIRRQFGLKTDPRRVRPAEQGISEMMVDLYRSFAKPLSEEMLFGWHRMLLQGHADLKDIGRYRTGKEPMQVISGPLQARRVHFEAPPSSKVRREMAQFIAWFNRTEPNRTAPTGRQPLPALTRAGLAHLYFESIHPFEDGNGRIGRAIADKALSQSVNQQLLTTLAATILARRKEYYAALGRASRSNEVTGWLAWFAGIAIEAQQRTIARVEFMIDKTRLLDRLRGQLNPRQEKALMRMLREGPDGFKGGLSAGNYATITGASPATTTRDLADLVNKRALVRTGELRHARYHLTIPVRKVEPARLDERGKSKSLALAGRR